MWSKSQTSSLYVTTLPGLVAIGTVVVEIKQFLFISGPYMTTCSKGCVNWWIEASYGKSPAYHL